MADAINTPDEEWRAIPGLEGYEASSLGRIRTLDRKVSYWDSRGWMSTRGYRGRILKQKTERTGYLRVPLKGARQLYVNRGVAMAFHGLPPTPHHQAAHLNGVREDNRPENLVWATPLENASHKFAHGTNGAGEQNPTSKLKEVQIPSIIERYANGEKPALLAREFGVTIQAIYFVAIGKTWSFVASEHRDAARIRAQLNMEMGRSNWVSNFPKNPKGGMKAAATRAAAAKQVSHERL